MCVVYVFYGSELLLVLSFVLIVQQLFSVYVIVLWLLVWLFLLSECVILFSMVSGLCWQLLLMFVCVWLMLLLLVCVWLQNVCVKICQLLLNGCEQMQLFDVKLLLVSVLLLCLKFRLVVNMGLWQVLQLCLKLCMVLLFGNVLFSVWLMVFVVVQLFVVSDVWLRFVSILMLFG